MITVRTKVFETNSSMTHSLVICEDHEYSKWLESTDTKLDEGDSKSNYYLFNPNNDKFLPYDEAIKENVNELFENLEEDWLKEGVTAEDIEEYAKGNKSLYELIDDYYEYYLTADEFSDHYYEYEVEPFEYTLKSGQEIEGFCYYGHD